MNANEKLNQSYWVVDRNMPSLLRELEKLNRRAERKGLSRFEFQVTDNRKRKEERSEISGQVIKSYDLVEVIVSGEAPKYAGWSLAAVLEHTPEGNIIRKVPDCKVDLMAYRSVKPLCQHCNTVRNRKDTYLVVHESGDIKQIGHDCIRDFLGHQDPHRLASLAEFWCSLGEMCGQGEDFDGFGGGGREDAIYARTLMAYAAMAIRRFGYVSRRYQEEHQDQHVSTTKDTVLNWMFPTREQLDAARRAGEVWPAPEPSDFEFADKSREFAVEQLDNKEVLNEFESNILVAAKLEAVEGRTAGIACYVPEYYRRALAQEEERKAKQTMANNAHFGEVGKRYRSITLKYGGCKSWESQFGLCFRHELYTEDGVKLTWKTSTGLDMVAGSKVLATFTVKAHGEWKGWKQTDISRATVEKI